MPNKIITQFFLLLLSVTCFAQSTSSVKGFQKISNTNGGLGNVLSYEGRFGNRIANMGDLDGDGVLDIAVGEEYADDGGSDKGAVWILFLKSDGTVKSKQKISETSGNLGFTLSYGTRFGFSVANIGDLNGDGVPELAVGSVVENSYSGAVWILYMKSDGTVKSSAKIDKNTSNFTSLDAYDLFAHDIVCPGDINNDGVNDIVVGACQDDDGGYDRGAIYVIFLNANGSVKGYKKISASTGGFNASLGDGDLFGSGVGKIGDVNSDGVPDLVVGAMFTDEVVTDDGVVYILTMNSDGTVKGYSKIGNSNLSTSNVLMAGDILGRGVSGISDRNGDGINDLIVGASQEDANGNDKGAVYIIYLNASQGVKGFEKINSQTTALSSNIDSDDKFGSSIATLEGFSQTNEFAFATGALFDDDGSYNSGSVYIVFLTPPPGTDLELSKVDLLKDTICPDSFASAIVYLKNTGTTPVSNPRITFVIEGKNTITQKFTYSGTIQSKNSASFNVKLNLHSAGVTNITAYYTVIMDTIKTNDTFRTSVFIQNTEALFSASNNCVNQSISFTNQTKHIAGDSIEYLWNFGDSTFSSDKEPLHFYIKEGTYKVILSAKSKYGCADTVSRLLEIYALPQTAFTSTKVCVTDSVNFTDSSADAVEWLWNFGDNSTSGLKNPAHKYSNPGLYNVTLSIRNTSGCTDSIVKQIEVFEMPEAIFSVHNICVTDSLYLTDASKGAVNWFWDFGDGYTETIQHPTHKFQFAGAYTIYLTVANKNGCTDYISHAITVDSTCVWPGDANADKIVDNKDILAIGLAFGDTGVTRIDTSTNWKANMVDNWNASFASGVDYKHADSDGNGIVGFNDTLAVAKNYSKSHAKKSSKTRGKNTDPSLRIDIQNDSLKAGDTLVAYIMLGENALPANDVYGLAFSINYNQDLFYADPIVDFSGSWLGNNLLTFSNNTNKLDFAITRTDHTNKSGFGKLATIKLIAKANSGEKQANFEISDNMIISSNEDIIDVKIEDDSIQINKQPNGIADSKNTKSLNLSVYPNPGNGMFNLVYRNSSKEDLTIMIYSIEGKKIWSGKMTEENIAIDLSNYPAGIYMLNAQSKNSQETVKLIKQ